MFFLGFNVGDGKAERGALPFLALHPNQAVVLFNKLAANHQPQSAARFTGGTGGRGVLFVVEEIVLLFSINSNALVNDRNLDALTNLFSFDPNDRVGV